MNDEQIVLLANWCEELMRDERFNYIYEQFKQTQTASLFGSKLGDAAAREFIYAKVHGVQEFLGLLDFYIVQRAQIIARLEAQRAQQEAGATDEQDIDY